MTKRKGLPERPWRTGTETFTITDTHPYHLSVGKADHKGAGEYEIAYKPARMPAVSNTRS